MKCFIVLFFIQIYSICLFAQVDTVKYQYFEIAEVSPEYPGGIPEFYKYITTNMKYPEEAREKMIEGKVLIMFIIDEKGRVLEETVTVEKGIHESLDNEAQRLIINSPHWIPGKLTKNGEPCKVRMALPITFKN